MTDTIETNIIGWRAFLVQRDKLVSPIAVSENRFTFNLYGPNVIRTDEPRPHENHSGLYGDMNTHGFYVFRRKSVSVAYTGFGGRENLWERPPKEIIYATVLCYGSVAYHTPTKKGDFYFNHEGFRAEIIEILGLYSHQNYNYRRGMANRLGWPKILPLKHGPEKFPLHLNRKVPQ